MPFIELKTNKSVSRELAGDLASSFGKLISILPGKTEQWLMNEVKGDCFMTFAGSDEPCAMVTVSLFGSSTDEAYSNMTAAVCDEVGRVLGIDGDRIYVKFEEVSTWGWKSMNF